MKDQTAMAAVNLYGVLGTLETLCSLDNEAKEILRSLKKPVSICFDIKGGPCATLHFTNDSCRMTEGKLGCSSSMFFPSPEKFNAMIDTGRPGIPAKNPVQLLSFLAGPFTRLTDRLTILLRPDAEHLRDRAFFEESTALTLYTIAGAISALANYDPISRISASYTPDGEVSLGIKDSHYATISVTDHIFTTRRAKCENPRAIMEFADIDLASGLFAGTASSINEVCRGRIRLAGMISMVDSINRILDRVAVYLA